MALEKERPSDRWVPQLMTARRKRAAAYRHFVRATELNEQADELEAEVERIKNELAPSVRRKGIIGP